MTERFLIRARLRRDRGIAALAPLLVPTEPGAKAGAAHRLVWSLFADAPDRARDFLWRETAPGNFLILAPRLPEDRLGLFEVDPPKPFAPVLAARQRLAFSLRANPVSSVGQGPKKRGKRRDVVTRAIAALPREPDPEQRRLQRWATMQQAARNWLERQGERGGFALDSGLRIDCEDWVRIPRPGSKPATFLAIEFEGVLSVRDPAAFLARLPLGFGAAKAFGCGLMLIRRARRGAVL